MLARFEKPATGTPTLDAGQLEALRDCLFGGGGDAVYLERLLSDAGFDVDAAVAMHFAAEVEAPPQTAKAPPPPQTPKRPAVDRLEPLELLIGAVFAVRGGDSDFKLHRQSAAPPRAGGVWQKRKQLKDGVADMIRGKLRKLGTDRDTLIGVDQLVVIKTESWLIKMSRALEAGALGPAPRLPTAKDLAAETKKRKASDISSTGEKRKGPRRNASAETDNAASKALSETMFLVATRDETRPSPAAACRAAPLRHVFSVLGSTGNVYDVTVDAEPSCTCPYASSHPTKVCKHRFFVFLKVLGVPFVNSATLEEERARWSYLPFQRHLRSDEVRAALFGDGAARKRVDGAVFASTAARAAYAKHRGARGDATVDDATMTVDLTSDASDDDSTPARPRHGDCCVICYDAIDQAQSSSPTAEAAQSPEAGAAASPLVVSAGAEACLRCGTLVHTVCLQKWFLHTTDRRCAVCRRPWKETVSATAAPTLEHGFLNLRALQPGAAEKSDGSSYAVDVFSGRRWADVHSERDALKGLRSAAPAKPAAPAKDAAQPADTP